MIGFFYLLVDFKVKALTQKAGKDFSDNQEVWDLGAENLLSLRPLHRLHSCISAKWAGAGGAARCLDIPVNVANRSKCPARQETAAWGLACSAKQGALGPWVERSLWWGQEGPVEGELGPAPATPSSTTAFSAPPLGNSERSGSLRTVLSTAALSLLSSCNVLSSAIEHLEYGSCNSGTEVLILLKLNEFYLN